MANRRRTSSAHGNAELKLEESVSVLFHRGIPPLLVPTNVSEDLTCEKLLIKCLEHIQSHVCTKEAKPETHGPNKYLPVFGLLVLPEEKIWLPFNHVFMKNSENHQKFKLRVRFRPPADKFSKGSSNIMTEYLLLQTLDDFLKGPLGENEKLNREKAFGLLCIALMFPPTLPMNSAEKVNEAFKSRRMNIWNYTRHFSKALAKRFISVPVIDHFWVYKYVTEEIHKNKIHESPPNLGWYKQKFYQLLMEALPEYCFEMYEATEINNVGTVDKVTAYISLYKESGEQEGLFYGEQNKCSLGSINSIKIDKPKDNNDKKWTVLIYLQDGPPKILLFSEEGAAESFVSMVQGYFRLCVSYDSVLCEELRTTSSKISTELKSFGPIGNADSYFEASTQTTESESGVFLIHESLDKFGTYHVKVRPSSNRNKRGSRNLPISGIIECLPDLHLKLKMAEEELIFGRCSQVRSHLKSKYGLQVVPSPRNFSVLADINDEFQETKIDYYGPHTSSEDVQESAGFLAMNGDLLRLSEIQDKNPLIKKYEVMFRDEHMMLMELQSHNEVYAVAFREGLVKLQTLYRIKKTSFLKFYCVVLDPKFSVLMEFTPHHDVLSYICTNPQSVAQKVHIMDQIIKILIVMEKENIYHGNLRLRKFYAFGGIEMSNQIKVKLGDPGVVSYFDKIDPENTHNVERAPWLSPERRKNLKNITYESEVYAVGTTMYELLCQTDQFHEHLKLGTNENILRYLEKNKHLPRPPVLDDNNTEPSSEEDEGNKPAPEALEVFTMIWEMILECWEEDETFRPSVSTLNNKMAALNRMVLTFDADTVLDKIKELAYDMGMVPKDVKIDDKKNLTVAEIEKELNSYLNQRLLPDKCLKVNTKDKLGEGFFGVVFKGEMRLPEKYLSQNADGKSKKLTEKNPVLWTPVAVKRIKSRLDGQKILTEVNHRNLYKEIKVACELDHPNIVKLLYLSKDIKQTEYDPLMMVMEFMNLESLSTYAGKYKKLSSPEQICHMLKILLDVAEGMVYLSGKGIVHRDLAARNVLLTDAVGGVVTAKVSDFGLARMLEENYRFYKVNPLETLPWIWMPPECFIFDLSDTEKKFSSQGDVWSFGIIMWESFSEGVSPRTILPKTWKKLPEEAKAEKLLKAYQKNWRYPGDKIISKEAYGIMKRCWEMEPSKRPPFVDLVQDLKRLISTLQGAVVRGN